MALKRVDERLSRLSGMVEKWNKSGNVPRIERDMALEELRRIYDELFDYTPNQEARPAVEVVAPAVVERKAEASETIEDNDETEAEEEVVEVVAAEDGDDSFEDALDIDALLGLSGEDSIAESIPAEPIVELAPEVEVAVEAEVVEPIAEPEPEVAPEPIAEPEVAEQNKAAERSAVGGLFDIDDIPVRAKSGRKMISLYDTPVKPHTPIKEEVAEPAEETPAVVSAAPAPQPAPAPAPQPVAAQFEEEAPQRLGDVIARNVTTLADKMAEEQPTTAFNRITDIRKAIGLNDKFLMIRDLFGGDAKLYEQTITRLNEFDDLDECMIFIVENFRWNPDSEGAKLLVSLIERKLS